MMAPRSGSVRTFSATHLLPVLSTVLTAATPLAALAGLAAMPASAWAQKGVKAIDPAYCVVTADRAGVRAGNHDSFYVVTDVKKGDVVVIDGEDAAWSRVVYAAGWPAFVGVGEGTYDAAGQTFTLSRPSMLLAYSTINPQYCWQALLPENKPLASGTKLKVQGEVKDAAGTVKGYRVNAPEGARGYVESRVLRRATKEETDAYKAKNGDVKPATPTPTPTPTPNPTPAPSPAANPAAAPTTPGSDRSLVDPQVKPTPGATPTPAANPGTTPAPTPTPTPTAGPTPGGTPAANPGGPAEIKQDSDPNKPAEPAKGPEKPVKPVDRKTATLEQLETAFNKVNGPEADPLTAEYEPLLAEIQKTIAELGDGPLDKQRKDQLKVRVEALKLRIGFRDTLRTLEESKRLLNTEIKKASEVVAAAEKSRVYNLVGTLSASGIYDGKNLPLMYRVVSADVKAPVTLGYISPEKDATLAAKVGQLVGVIGVAVMDPTLKVSVIRPVRVDVLGQGAGEALPLLKPTELPKAPPAKSPAATPAATPAPAKPIEIEK